MFKTQNTLAIGFVCLTVGGLLHKQGGIARAGDAQVEKLGSSSGITTEISRETAGKLTDDDVKHVSILAGQVVYYLNDARKALDTGSDESVQNDLKQALEVLHVVRQILPVTTVTVTIKDAKGKIVHSDTRRQQTAEVPLYQIAAAVDFLQPIVEAKQKTGEASGVKLTHRDFLQARFTLNLRITEGRIRQAQKQLAMNREQAEEALALALSDGVTITIDEFEAPLAEVREALILAHRAIDSHNSVEAKANLATARERLAVYRDLLPDQDRAAVDSLAAEISDIEKQVAHPNAATHHAGAQERISSVFRRLFSSNAKGAAAKTAVKNAEGKSAAIDTGTK